MLKQIIQKKFDFELNSQQLNAVKHIDGPALILACPGSGKTSTLLFRTFNLIYNVNIDPKNILSMTFSRAAANDMEQKYDSLFGNYINKKAKFSTIHSFTYGVLKNYYSKICGQDFKVLNEKKYRLLKQIYEEVNNEIIHEDKLDDLESTIGYFKNTLVPLDKFEDYKVDIPSFKEIYIQYGQYKRKNHLLDYDDMLTITLWLFNRYPNILEYYKNKYQYIQVDEAQDISKVQHEIIKLLIKPNNNLFMVADDDQSIYSWRGANVEFLLNFKKEFKNAKVYYMEQNFRSTQDIIESSSKCIQNNKKRFDKKMYTNTPNKRPVNIVSVEDYNDQIIYMVNQLKALKDLKDSAILFRKNISVIPLIDILEKNNIKFYIRDHKNSFFTHFAVNDIISFLKVAIDNNDLDAFIRICYKTNGYISKTMMQSFENQSYGNIFERLKNSSNLSSRQCTNINKLQKKFKTLQNKSPNAAISFVLINMGYKDSLETYCKRFGYSIDNVYNIISALTLIAENTNTIVEFIYRLDELEELLKDSNKVNVKHAVTLSTLHSSKGLEFKNVFIYDLLQETLPSSKAIELFQKSEPSELEEERRLFYVGMTRSKEYLDLITINGRQSQFLNEIKSVEADKLKIGSTVFHSIFGEGYIKAIDISTFVVKFQKHGVKKLNKHIVTEKNLLTLKEV